MLSNDLLSVLYYLDDRTALNGSELEKLTIRLEQCRNDAKQLEQAITPNVVTLHPSELKGNVVPLHVARRRTPSPNNDGDIA